MPRSRRFDQSVSALESIFGAGGALQAVLPEFEPRPAQLRMAVAVHEAIETGQTLLAEAGTGTGKTLAYVVPAILSGRKTVIATGTKTLQDQLFFKDLPALASVFPRPFGVSLMKGRGNYLCRRNLRRCLEERHARAERNTLLKIQAWSATSTRGDRAELVFLPEPDPLWDDIAAWSESCLGTSCEDFEECFLTRMRQAAAGADLVIVNHHLLMADAVLRDSTQFQVIPSFDVLILDEAHLLEEVATDFFGLEFSNFRIERLIRDTQREWGSAPTGDRGIPAQLSRLAEGSARFFQSLELPEGVRRLRPDALGSRCREAARDLVQDLILLHDQIQAATTRPEGLLSCARRARQQATILVDVVGAPEAAPDASEPAVVRWSERRGRGVFLHASPLDVSADFRRTILESAGTVILTSATLSAAGRFDFLRDRLGIREAREFQVASPFDFERQSILYIPRHLPEPRSPGFLAAAAEEARGILEITQGRALILFTSFEAMEATYRLLLHRVSFPLMIQGEAPRTELLDRFREEVGSVLLATRSFWQGVDVVGEALSCVIIHKLPFGFPGDPILEARLEHIQQQGGDPFWEYQVPSAIIMLRQGLGRLIRSERDRGALCILDSRLLSRGYGRVFLESLPACPVTTVREDLRRFFSGRGGEST